MKKYILAYDLGTSGVKGAVVDMKGGMVATATEGYPLITPGPALAEQDPELYWAGVCRVTGAVLERAGISPDEIGGIAFGTLWKGIIPVDSRGRVLHNSIIWLDARAGEEAAALNRRFGDGIFSAADYWPKLMWLARHRPDVIAEADTIHEVNSFLKWKATGVSAMDISNCYVRSPDLELDRYYGEIMEFCGIDRAKFPPICRATDLVGRVTAAAAQEMGLCEGIPVFGGNNDIQAITVGAGCAEVGGVHMYFGSSGWTGYTIPHQSEEIYVSYMDTDRDVFIFGMQAIGLSFNWAVNKFYTAERQRLGDGVFAMVDREVETVPAGSEGVMATPWFFGERPPLYDSDARGCFLNLSANHDRRHMTRAVMEGVCMQFKMGQQYNRDARGLKMPKAINVIGGGACSDVWMQMLSDVMELPVRVPEAARHAGAVGTAYSALIGLGVVSSYAEAADGLSIRREFYPIPENVAVYKKSFSVFSRIYTALHPVFTELNG